MFILSFDLGDFNAESAWVSMDTHTGDIQRGGVPTNRESFMSLFAGRQIDVILCEACCMTAMLYDVVHEVYSSIEFKAANTNSDAWSWRKVKKKTDMGDAERLLRMYRLDDFPEVYMPNVQVRSLRRLTMYLHIRHINLWKIIQISHVGKMLTKLIQSLR